MYCATNLFRWWTNQKKSRMSFRITKLAGGVRPRSWVICPITIPTDYPDNNPVKDELFRAEASKTSRPLDLADIGGAGCSRPDAAAAGRGNFRSAAVKARSSRRIESVSAAFCQRPRTDHHDYRGNGGTGGNRSAGYRCRVEQPNEPGPERVLAAAVAGASRAGGRAV